MSNSAIFRFMGPHSVTTNREEPGGNVQPTSALYVVNRSGVCVHPNFNSADSVFKAANADAIVLRVSQMGMSFIRGMMAPNSGAYDEYVAACRKYKVKWLMTVVPEAGTRPTDQTLEETRAKVRHIRDNLADICAGIEGLNEPNHNRGGGAVPLDWATTAYNHQAAIWDTAKADLANGSPSPIKDTPIVGPSLHDVAADNSYTQTNPSGGRRHYHQLLNAGIKAKQDFSGLHTYPGGSYPERKLQERLDRIYDAYGLNYPVWCTEWGYHNAMATTAGHNPIAMPQAGSYGPRGFIQYVIQRNLVLTYYELLDDYDPGTKSEHEHNFGMYTVSSVSADDAVRPATWEPKPVSTKVGNFLNALSDPAGTRPYTPNKVVLEVVKGATDVEFEVTATKAQSDAGQATVWMWRNKDIWNRDTLQPINVPSVSCRVTDRLGARNFDIDGEVTRIDLR